MSELKNKQAKNVQKNHVSQNDSKTLTEHFQSRTQDVLGDTPFHPRIKQHISMLSQTHSDEERANMISHLQQSYGNKYVQRLVESIKIQTKLDVSQPGDPQEQQADKVAKIVSRAIETQIQRQPEEEEEVQMQSTDNQPQVIYRDLETRINNARGSGQPLADIVREPMEQAFSTNFADVRVHTNSEANEINRQLSARAFTTGQDIYFRDGEYSPSNSQGRELLAHELTHVVQQTQGHVNPTRQVGGVEINDDEQLEKEADEMRAKIGRTQQKGKYRSQQDKNASSHSGTTQLVAQLNGKPTITSETELSAPDGSADTRRKVGVGEKVTFKGSAAGKWSATGGTPTELDNNDTFEWTAPDRQQAVAIRLSVGGIESSVWMNVIEPNSITAMKNSEMNFPAGTAGAGMKLTFNYYPKTVSFGNVEAKEVSGPPTNISGYYQKHYTAEQLKHDSGDTFYPIKEDNKDTAEDTASTQDPYTPWENGTFDWVIPNHFKVNTETGDGKKFTEVTQAFSMDATGKIKITKASAEVERTP